MTSTLLEVHVIFRHGDRTPDKNCLYPKDPHKGFTYLPTGYGQLINKGKERAYALGQILRRKYDVFLGDVYTPEILDSWCSEYDRTKMTLQLVLAALFPPKGDQIWNDTLLWQPIPFNYLPQSKDNVLLPNLLPVAMEAGEDYMRGPGKSIVESKLDLFRYLQDNSGLEITTAAQAIKLIATLSTQKNMGLELPSWAEDIWPHEFVDVCQCLYDTIAATPKLKYFSAGKLLEIILNNTRAKIEGKSKCKMHLYSGHEFSIAVLLRIMQTSQWQIPSYCANLIFELHNIDGVHGFKIYYQSNLDQPAELLNLGDYGSFCPFEEFVRLTQYVLDEKHLNPNF